MMDEETSLKLNMKIILDVIEENYNVDTYLGIEENVLVDKVRLTNKGTELIQKYLYVGTADSINPEYLMQENFLFILTGHSPVEYDKILSSCIFISESYNYLEVFEKLQCFFEKVFTWAFSIQAALNQDAGISRLCELSIDFFQNPLFVHDDQFFVISCPKWLPGMIKWDTDARTGRKITPVNIINDFKIDKEYMQTLHTDGPQIFSAALRGYRILYMNIRDGSRYHGRLCICELQTSFRPIHFFAVGYLVKMFVLSLRKRSLYRESLSNTLESFFTDILKEEITDKEQIASGISPLSWNICDKYLCLKMGIEHRDVDILSTDTTICYIETNLLGSYAFLYESDILIIVNLSIGKYTRMEVLSKLSYLLREGLFKAGSSIVFKDFSRFPDYYLQAKIALEYGKRSSSMVWHYEFENYALKYICDQATKELSKELISSDKIQILKNYDIHNNTSLYKTLAVYLKNEKNIMKTSRELFIHRSTLFYRLERIQNLTGADLEDMLSRIYILLSYVMLEGTEGFLELFED